MMKKIIISLATTLFVVNISIAGEGMWLPLLLKALNESEMQDLGMKLTAEDIYSVNNGSLKDAIAHFGGFCTSEVISDQGLLLTNHHCGYSAIQSHSTLEDNYLKNGFWAKTKADEKANPGLFAMFIERIDDVTEQALAGVSDDMSNTERQSIIDKNIAAIKSAKQLTQFQEVVIKPFFHGNQYFMFLTKSYPDVRLVGAPPESIGKFGADTDNWVWPRHTGDFSLFRIYAGPDNEPAEYSADNKPYTPKHSLPISLDGVEQGDFTLVFGFPGRTNQYLPSYAIEQIMDKRDPVKIEIRDIALKIMDKHMRSDEEARLKYASKFASIANYWKKWIGESTGLKKTNAVGRKQKLELEFQQKAAKEYLTILPQFKKLYADIEEFAILKDYYGETTGRSVEIIRVAGWMRRLISTYEENGDAGYDGFKDRLQPYIENLYKNYDPKIDLEVYNALMNHYKGNVKPQYTPKMLFSKVMEGTFFRQSVLSDGEKLMALLEGDKAKAVAQLKSDPMVTLVSDWTEVFNKEVNPKHDMIQKQIDSLQRVYMKALMETFPDRNFYPDANSTMRVTYGQVQPYSPMDAVTYDPVTYLDGVMEKYVPGDYEFDVQQKLIDLYEKKDYGNYADTNGKLPVCFIGTNHTTGGNSGSPAIDAHGNLIGLNFDRAWEGTMSDLNYDPSICRNIMVDARYILFVIDKFADAPHLIEEMKLVHPKGK